MASIRIRDNKDGSTSYTVEIRKKNIEIRKTFSRKEDALVYVAYKERLIDLMDNFDVAIKDRITLQQLFELKINSMANAKKRDVLDYENAKNKLTEIFGHDAFYKDISFDRWKEAAKFLLQTDVYRGVKSETTKRKMSLRTLKKIIAYASASVSYAQGKKIELDNLPLKLIQVYINPMVEEEELKNRKPNRWLCEECGGWVLRGTQMDQLGKCEHCGQEKAIFPCKEE